MSAEYTCCYISKALDLIGWVHCSATYVNGYINALLNEGIISCDGAQLLPRRHFEGAQKAVD